MDIVKKCLWEQKNDNNLLRGCRFSFVDVYLLWEYASVYITYSNVICKMALEKHLTVCLSVCLSILLCFVFLLLSINAVVASVGCLDGCLQEGDNDDKRGKRYCERKVSDAYLEILFFSFFRPKKISFSFISSTILYTQALASYC